VTQLDPSSASCRILKRELEVEGILLSIVVAGLITCSDYIYSVDKHLLEMPMDMREVGGGGKQKSEAETEIEVHRERVCVLYYFISTPSTIYPTLVLIVKE
jgi:hypothetical protein